MERSDRHVPRKPHPLGCGQGAPYQRREHFREAPPLQGGELHIRMEVVDEVIGGLLQEGARNGI